MVKSKERFREDFLTDNFILKALIVTVQGTNEVIEVHEELESLPDSLVFSVPEHSKLAFTIKYVVKSRPIKKISYYHAIKKAGIPIKSRHDGISDVVEPNTPENPVYTYTFSPDDIPGGFFARGTHPASSHFYEDGKEFLSVDWHIEITKKGSKSYLKT